ncbi:hypothetical protein [Falsiroseomonas selenitidurans]|uniref:hypothetical protein n=1 Tax=Falsiroseomonas selenitidurans TaxID=2716335 RepID=UPI00143C0847|nr:hypothetical protein [Falsiroseomonas selenitidurans]
MPPVQRILFQDLHQTLESALRHAAEQAADRPAFLREAASEISEAVLSTFQDEHGGVTELGLRSCIAAALADVLPRLLEEYE